MKTYKPRKRVPVRPQKSAISYILPFLIIIGLGVLGATVYNFFNDAPAETDIRTTNAKIYVTLEEGADAKVKPWGKNEKMNVKNDSIIYAGDTIITDGTGISVLKFDNGTILRLAPQTELNIENVTNMTGKSHISTILEKGNVWANITKENTNYILKTDNIILIAKGGVFDTGISEGGYETINDIEGVSEVSVMGMLEQGRVGSIQKYNLEAGQTFSLDEEKLLALTDPTEAPVDTEEEIIELVYVSETPAQYLESNWYKNNSAADKLIAEREGDISGEDLETPADNEDTDTPDDTDAPLEPSATLAITSHSTGESTGEADINLTGTHGDNVKSITVNGKKAVLDGAGEWAYSITLEPGSNKISLKAYSANDKIVAEKSLTISLDESAPEAPVFTQPESGSTQEDMDGVVIKGTVSEDTHKVGVTDSTSGKEYLLSAYIPGSTTWGYNAKKEYTNLSDGENTYTVVAYDKAGNPSEAATLTFTYSPSDQAEFTPDTTPVQPSEPEVDTPVQPEDSTDDIIPGVSDTEEDAVDTPVAPVEPEVVAFGSPTITIPTSAGTFSTSLEEVALGGKATEGTAQILLNGSPIDFSAGSTRWSKIVTLADGANTFTIKSVSDDGETSTAKSITITKE